MGRDFEPSPLQGYQLRVKSANADAKWPKKDQSGTVEGVEVKTADSRTGQDSKYPVHWPHFIRQDGKLGTFAGSGLVMRHCHAVFPEGYFGLRPNGGINFEEFLMGPTGQGRIFLWEDYAQGRGSEYPIRLPVAEVDDKGNLIAGKPENAFLETFDESQQKKPAPAQAAAPATPAGLAQLPPSGPPPAVTSAGGAPPATPAAPPPVTPTAANNGLPVADVKAALEALGKKATQSQIVTKLIELGKGTSVGPFLNNIPAFVAQGAFEVGTDGSYTLKA